MSVGKIISAVMAGLVALVALGLIVGGAVLLWAHGTQRDGDGFLTSPDYQLQSSGYAVVSEDIDLGSRPSDWWPSDLADVRFDIRSTDPDVPGVFIGIGATSAVEEYLGGVARHEVTELGTSGDDVTYRSVAGGAPPGPPTAEDFWETSVQGSNVKTPIWDVEQGEWTVVAMNADGSQGVALTVEAGVRIGILLGVGIGLLGGGLLLALAAAALLVWAVRRPVSEVERSRLPEGVYPVVVEGELEPGLSRWLWLVKWFLAIPHLVVLAFLWVAAILLTVVAGFAILFTGRYPRAIFEFNVGVMRWTWRVEYYAFSVLGTDTYPPFTLHDADYPARLDVEYPEQLSRGLVLVKWWLLAIPHYIIVGLFAGSVAFGGGLIGILVLVAVVVLAFTARYPQEIFDLVMGLNRWAYRVMAYAALMRDEYPPFRLDMGGEDPAVRSPEPPVDPDEYGTLGREMADTLH